MDNSKNDKSLGANVQSGLSSRERITETPEALGMDNKGKIQAPIGGSGTSHKGGGKAN